jgi:hypothetical protein
MRRAARLRVLAAAALVAGCASMPQSPPQRPAPPEAAGLRIWVNTLSAETDANKMVPGGTVEEQILPALAIEIKRAGFHLVFGPQDADAAVDATVVSGPWVSSVFHTTLTARTRQGEEIMETEFVGGNLYSAMAAYGNPERIARAIAANLVDRMIASPEFLAFARRPRSGAAAAAAKAGPAARSDVDEPRYKRAEDPGAFAVVVGVEGYSNDLPKAEFAERDAEAVRGHLVALGFPERNIKLLTGSRAVRSALEAYLEDWLPRNVRENGRVFVYFAGNGAPDPATGRAYLVPWDGDPGFLDRTAYPLKRLYAGLGALKTRRVIVALDAGFSGAGARSVLAKGARPLVAQADASAAAGGRLTRLSAAGPTQSAGALDDQGHGLFTYHLLKGLNEAAGAGARAATVRGVFDALKPRVQDAAGRQDREQTPVLEGPDDAFAGAP